MKNKCFIATLFFFVLLFHPFDSTIQADETNRSIADALREQQTDVEDGEAAPQHGIDAESNNLLSGEEASLGTEDNYVVIFIKMLFALAVVVVIIVFLLKYIGKKSQSYHSTRTLQNIGGVPLGANKSVQLIKVGNQILVVGVGESIQLLKEINDETEVNQIIQQQMQQTDIEQTPFFTHFFNRLKDSATSNKLSGNDINFKNLLEKQLKDVKESQKKIYAAIKEKDQ